MSGAGIEHDNNNQRICLTVMFGIRVLPKDGRPFKAQMEEHLDDPVRPCKYVHGPAKAGFDSMTPEQIEYYVYWRDLLRRGILYSTDEMYVATRLCEIANGSDPVESACAQLDTLWGRCSCAGLLLLDFIPEYKLLHGCDLSSEASSAPAFPLMVSSLMASPPRRIGLETALDIGGRPPLRCKDKARLEKLFNKLLLVSDSHMLRATGKGLSATYGHRAVIEMNVLEGYLEGGGEDICVEYDEFPENTIDKAVRSLLTFADRALTGCTTKTLFPRGFTPALLEELRIAAGSETDLERGPRGEWKGLKTWPAPKGRPKAPRLFRLPAGATSMPPSFDLLKVDMHINWGRRPAGKPEYVTSGRLHPSYRTFDEAQAEYYLYFRECALNGTCADTDPGYLWLLLSELVSRSPSPEVLDVLVDLFEAYPQESARKLTVSAVSGYALLYGLPPRPGADIPSYALECWTLDRLLGGQEGSISARALREICDGKKWDRYGPVGQDCADICIMVLQAINRECGHDWVSECCLLEYITSTETLFKGLAFIPGSGCEHNAVCAYKNFGYSTEFCQNIARIVKSVMACLNAYGEGKAPRIRYCDAFELDVSDLVKGATAAYLQSKEREAALKDFALDADAVDEAHRDLEKVTVMMATEEPEGGGDAPAAAEEAPSPASGDPWSAFASSLTDAESGLLRSLLDGKDADAELKAMGCPLPKAQDSINAKAMDSIGDIVIEDGSVVEDYAEDLRRCLRRSADGFCGSCCRGDPLRCASHSARARTGIQRDQNIATELRELLSERKHTHPRPWRHETSISRQARLSVITDIDI